jgi:hypothetical protein
MWIPIPLLLVIIWLVGIWFVLVVRDIVLAVNASTAAPDSDLDDFDEDLFYY